MDDNANLISTDYRQLSQNVIQTNIGLCHQAVSPIDARPSPTDFRQPDQVPSTGCGMDRSPDTRGHHANITNGNVRASEMQTLGGNVPFRDDVTSGPNVWLMNNDALSRIPLPPGSAETASTYGDRSSRSSVDSGKIQCVEHQMESTSLPREQLPHDTKSQELSSEYRDPRIQDRRIQDPVYHELRSEDRRLVQIPACYHLRSDDVYQTPWIQDRMPQEPDSQLPYYNRNPGVKMDAPDRPSGFYEDPRTRYVEYIDPRLRYHGYMEPPRTHELIPPDQGYQSNRSEAHGYQGSGTQNDRYQSPEFYQSRFLPVGHQNIQYQDRIPQYAVYVDPRYHIPVYEDVRYLESTRFSQLPHDPRQPDSRFQDPGLRERRPQDFVYQDPRFVDIERSRIQDPRLQDAGYGIPSDQNIVYQHPISQNPMYHESGLQKRLQDNSTQNLRHQDIPLQNTTSQNAEDLVNTSHNPVSSQPTVPVSPNSTSEDRSTVALETKKSETTVPENDDDVTRPTKPVPRASYFLNLSDPGAPRNPRFQTEPRHAKIPVKKSPSSGNTKDLRIAVLESSVRKNCSNDDQVLQTPTSNTEFVRGGVRRSLQLAKPKKPLSGTISSPGVHGSRIGGLDRGKTTPMKDGTKRETPDDGGTIRNQADDGRVKGSSQNLNWNQAISKIRINIEAEDEMDNELLDIEKINAMKRQEIGGMRMKTNQEKEDSSQYKSQTTLLTQFGTKSLQQNLQVPQKTIPDGGGRRSPVEDFTDSARRNVRDSMRDLDRSYESPLTAFNRNSLLRSSDRPRSAHVRNMEQRSNTPNSHIPVTGRTRSNPVPDKQNSLTTTRRIRTTSENDQKQGETLVRHGSRRHLDRPTTPTTHGNTGQSNSMLTVKNSSDLLNPTKRKTINKMLKDTNQSAMCVILGQREKERDMDTASEFSDTLSTFSMNGTTLLTEVFANLTSSSASQRKDGLGDLQYLLRSGTMLSNRDVKRLTEIFTRMFHEPQVKVFSLFVEVLVDFIHCLAEDLDEWIPICLNRLLSKASADLLGSVQLKIRRALEAVRKSFAFDQQMFALSKFVSEPLATSNNRVKEALLHHLHELISSVNPSDLNSDEEFQSLWNGIIGWSMESKSLEVRKSAQKLIISAFNLNPPSFSVVLSREPKPSQDFVRKILHNHLRTTSNSIEEEDDDDDDYSKVQRGNRVKGVENRSLASNLNTVGRQAENTSARGTTELFKHSCLVQEKGSRIASSRQTHYNQKEERYTPKVSDSHNASGTDEILQRQDSKSSGSEQQVEINWMSEDSGIYFNAEEAKDEYGSDMKYSPVFLSPDHELAEGVLNGSSISAKGFDGKQVSKVNEIDKTGDTKHLKLRIAGDVSSWSEVVAVFSDANASEDKRKKALRDLIKSLPTNYEEISGDNLKTMLCILLLTSGGTDEVSELADECISLLLKTRSSMKRVQILKEVADNSDFPINLAALKLQYSEFVTLDQDVVRQNLSELVPSLITAYENDESRVRKAALLSLVHLYKVVGEDLLPLIERLNDSKKNLLMLYFKKASTLNLSSTSSE